jgi:CDP-diacylglycerol--glycerol-3-phosphate 3-phosphatidyltransferase
MADLISALVLSAVVLLIAVTWAVSALLPSRARNQRLDGYGGILLGRGVMEVAYKLSEPLIRVLLALRVTPNMVTAFSLLPALLSAVCMAEGHFGLGALLAFTSGFCDMIDGILARRCHTTSDAGELFDAAVDRYVEFLLLAGMAFYFRTRPVAGLLTLGAIMGSFMVSYTTAKAEALGVPPPKGAMRRAERSVYLIFGSTLVPFYALLFPNPRMLAGISIGRELPAELAILVVAVVANVSAVRRMLRTAELIRAKKLVP